ncbi:DUF418 domain-containing protein [Clavibacter sp. Sh2141]|uniref:DUF418 domain-containing protein n=1 Tax=Clavibacter sp. Sh2141 TaxID=3395374 RepID=UPI0039BD24A7
MTENTAPPPAPAPAAPSTRIDALDVIRGVALCGILLVNIGPLVHFGYETDHLPANLGDASGWLQLLVQQRFFPIFSLLFGIGFSLFLASAARRHPRPRLLLVRRLLVLLPLGILHQLVHPGEALLFYAVCGLVILLPSSFLPRGAVAGLAAVLIPAALVVTGGGIPLIPGLFLLGSALVRYGVVARFPTAVRGPAILFALFAAASAGAIAWQLQDLPASGFSTSSAVAGAALAGAYVTGLLLLLRTPAAPALRAVFAPLGRTALSGYVLATPVMIAIGALLDLPHSGSWGLLLGAAVGVLAVQRILTVLWLRAFRQGPLEWLWRCATWGRWLPLRREPGGSVAQPTGVAAAVAAGR